MKLTLSLKTMCAAVACIPFSGMGAAYVAAGAVANEDISASAITIETGVTDIPGGELSPSFSVTDGEYAMTSEGGITVNNGRVTDGENNVGAIGVDGTGSKLVVTAGGDIDLGSAATSRHGAYANKGGELEMRAGEGGTIRTWSSQGGGVSALIGSRVVVYSNVEAIGNGEGNGAGATEGSTMVFYKNFSVSGGMRGIMAITGSSVTVHGNFSAHDVESGINSVDEGSSVTVNGRVDIRATGDTVNNYGIISIGGGSVTINGGTVMNTVSNRSMFARAATITANAAQYDVRGDIYAAEDATISLSMNGRSMFTGKTNFHYSVGTPSTGTINLDLQGDSLWTVTGNSQLTNLTLGQGSALQLAFSGSSLTDVISATGTITLEAGSMIYLTGDLSGLEGSSFDFFDGTLVNNGVKFVGFDGTDWVEYEYTQTGANTFEFSANAPVVIEEPGFIPEPATATLGLLGLASLMVRRRRA